MVIARSYILACGRRGAVHFAPSARRCGQKGNTRRGSGSDCLSCSGAARARASLRRWSARALDVHAGTYVEVFLIFGVNRRSSWQLCHIPSETGGARASQPTQNDATDRPGAWFQGPHRDGSSRTARGFALNARRSAPPVEHLLRKLTARTSLLRGVRGRRRVLPRHGDGPVLGVVLGDLVDRVL